MLALPAGQMAVQGNVGGGSFVCGLRRVLSEYHTLEFQGAVGEYPRCAALSTTVFQKLPSVFPA